MFWGRKERSRENKLPSGIEVTAVYNTNDTIGGIEEGGSSDLDRFYFLASSSSPQLAAKVRELNSQPNIDFDIKISILNGIQREASITLIYPYQDESGNLKAIISNKGDNVCLVIRNGRALTIEEDPGEPVDLDEGTQILVLNQRLFNQLKPKRLSELSNPDIINRLRGDISRYTQTASMLVMKSKKPTKIEETKEKRALSEGWEEAVSQEQISRIQNSQNWVEFFDVLQEIGTVTDRRYQYDYNYFDNCYHAILGDRETVDLMELPLTYGIKDKFRELAYEDLIKALVSSMQSLEDLANLISYLYNKRLNLKNDQNQVLETSILQALVGRIFNDGDTNSFNQIPTRYGLRDKVIEIYYSRGS